MKIGDRVRISAGAANFDARVVEVSRVLWLAEVRDGVTSAFAFPCYQDANGYWRTVGDHQVLTIEPANGAAKGGT